jgi:hypothetical protein
MTAAATRANKIQNLLIQGTGSFILAGIEKLDLPTAYLESI